MNVRELREALEGLPDETEVRMAHQPSWPLQTTVSRAVAVGCDQERIDELEEALGNLRSLDDLDDDERREYDEMSRELDDLRRDGNQRFVLWLAEGQHPWDEGPYLPGVVVKALEWR